MSDDDRTRRLQPWSDPTRRLPREEDYESTRRLQPDEGYDPQTMVFDQDYRPGQVDGSDGRPPQEVEDDRRPRWALPLVTGILGLIAGMVLVLVLSGGGAQDTVPRSALAELEAATAASLQGAQAEISQRDARIAELEQQLAQVDADQDAAASSEEQALEARRQALDEREAALDARDQALNEREQAQGGDSVLPDLPGVDLPDVSLPDIQVPEEEARNLLERFLDLFRGEG